MGDKDAFTVMIVRGLDYSFVDILMSYCLHNGRFGKSFS